MMFRQALLLIMLSGIISSPAFAEQYVLRIETRGYLNAPVDKPEPPDGLLGAIEVLVVPGEKFYGKTLVGDQTLSMRGRFNAVDKGPFTIDDLNFLHETAIRDEHGKPERLSYKRSQFNAGVMIELDQSRELGSVVSGGTIDMPKGTRSKQQDVLILKAYKEEREE